jgi:Holliday junction resolvase
MAVPVEYLEAARVEELRRYLESEGYQVTQEVTTTAGPRFDLIARKGDQILAVEVKARSRLSDQAEVIQQLRERARREGYRFQLAVVNPPRERTIEIPGLESELETYLLNNVTVPPGLAHLSQNTSIEGVSSLDIASIEVLEDEIQITGAGLIEVKLVWGGGEANDGMSWYEKFPFDFEATLDRYLHVTTLEFKVDISSYTDEQE